MIWSVTCKNLKKLNCAHVIVISPFFDVAKSSKNNTENTFSNLPQVNKVIGVILVVLLSTDNFYCLGNNY